MTPNLKDRIAVVTGASRGIGYFTALELAKAGAHVVACARTLGGLEELDDAIKAFGGSATLVPFDLSDMAAIDKLGGAINERWGKLDIMVANAGVLGTISPIGHVEAKVFEKVMAINVTATWRLIRSLEPLLVRSDAGRALILSSSAAHKCKPFWGPYSASKAAVEALARTWAYETQRLPLRILSVDPGATRTAMRAQAVPGEDPETLPHPSEVAQALLPLLGREQTETGKLFIVREKKIVDYRMPE
ncbi:MULTISPECIES: SDR family NAD(P)-dependent oxidoreductase [Sinorhizobium]|jgi:NAD(P)-dependent dehydrogenase (short-subunit alcohol dehydrogenase family)|uniref:Short-chain dehydrogenase/reductase SDR n=5 Tax=Sinorhizobium TaxID=28105 RepID=H0G591_RHIML|nr:MULTISPECIES: SDR family NAD(P)-dependent oxidoreductase [Sinorhizobium]PST27798.1 oxidoreductase [Mesorhizobium loti]TWB02722.1 NAD(P)-dependent dehydrogenase (short-subunit alcohol dehydrogenase family) [Ensifer sp. SEMIA 134]TWB36590.1 NAD(P)-dependent dehydrogenase (short-subunit alcohol dehydrogenase family) [Ensifer sp. SEMIA 135]AEG03681.1 short-chain dehydrogenase/reductase SDR [Sinorhizobium meliloti BL225C]AEG52672.1 short-chain dehydrogenase/reductase SDR [Sinorhizobium meliloti 